MEIKIIENNSIKTAILTSNECLITNLNEALDLISNAYYQGAEKLIIKKENLIPGFFDLKTGFAGDVLQKCSNYRMKLAIIGDFSKYKSNALKAFIVECNRGNQIYFVDSEQSAKEKLR
ncbi:DUF4180 domain-containing protein [Myxococcota bacterium]|nr:DUF4180 domain-containing protein [Myxococcota bacterium]MBU1379594.1 DUF4180 domain-containing protein [Myxococcota bacterium]MBU1496954.1 DUF4180 domain-containing protein [Myxococcota bacterium]